MLVAIPKLWRRLALRISLQRMLLERLVEGIFKAIKGLSAAALIGLGLTLLGTVILILLKLPLFMLFIDGGVWLGEAIYPWLVTIGSITIGVALFVLLPLSFINRTRNFSASSLFIASLVFELNLWVLGFLLTFHLLGGWAVLLGLFIPILGGGVVIFAILAALINAMWPQLCELVFLFLLVVGLRKYGQYLENKWTTDFYIE